MTPHEVMTCFLTGCLLVAFGVIPGLYQGLVDGLAEGIQRFRDQISPGFPTPMEHTPIQKPTWLAGLGALLMVLSVLGYLSN